MSYQLQTGVAIGEIPDTVRGTPQVEAAEEDYKVSYAYGVCSYLREAFPEQLNQMFGSFENCVRTMGTAADLYFDKWKVRYPIGVATKAIATVRGTTR